jgi:hypothetical protein
MPKAAAVEFTTGESVAIAARQGYDAESGIIRGWKAASDPTLVTARKAANVARTSAITAQLLADLS